MNFNFARIIDIHLNEKRVLIRPRNQNDDDLIHFWYFFSDAKFNNFVYLYKKWLKSQPSDRDRVAYFESLDPDGVFSMSKHDSILKSRLNSN